MANSNSGFLLQSTFGSSGNFEVVAPSPRGGLVHAWRNNDQAGFPWMGPEFFASGYLDGVSLIQSYEGAAPGNLELVVRVGDRLAYYRRRDSKWMEPFYFASGISGRPALIQSSLGVKGNYEVVVPLAAGGLAHYSRNNDDPGQPWSDPSIFATEAGKVNVVALIQSNFGIPGNLEVIANVGDGTSRALVHFWRDSGPAFSWSGANPVPLSGGGVPVGIPGFIQSRFGNTGNFELVTALSTGGMAYLSRNNDDPNLPWSPPMQFGNGSVTEVSLIQSNFGNLEIVARTGDRFEHFWRDGQVNAWNGPTAVVYEEPARNLPVEGEWRIPYSSDVVGIHAALLRTGKLLFFTYLSEAQQGQGGSSLLDPESGVQILMPPEARDPFCGGHCFLADGRLFVAGGTGEGIRSVHTFTPDDAGGRWQELPDLSDARWYPTCTALPDRRVFIISGTKDGRVQPDAVLNDTYEIFSPQDGLAPPVPVPFLNEIAPVSIYPFVFVLPSRKLFLHGWNKTCFVDLATWTFRNERITTVRPEPRNYPVQGTCVLLPLLPTANPPYRARVMLIGGGGVPPATEKGATETCEILDLGATPLQWRSAPSLARPRVMGDAVLLPDGTVLVVNGSSAGWAHDAKDPVYEAQIYNLANNSWKTVCPTRVPRLYHSTAILLPDARVLTAGTDETYNIEPFKKSELRLEVFSPPYLFRGPRPQFAAVPSEIHYGASFAVQTPDAVAVASAALIRPGAVTHSFNMDQRYIGLTIQARGSQELTLRAPPDGFVAPPGYYMLFLLNGDGVPSVARFVRLS